MWKKNQNQKEEQLEEKAKLFRFPLTVLFLLTFCSLFAEVSFHFNSTLLEAQRKNYELQLIPARQLLELEKEKFPDNYAVDYLLHFNYLLEAFITEEQSAYDRYQKIKETALNHYQNLPDSLAYKKFAQSEVYFYSATLKAKFNELYSAAKDINKAQGLIEKNHELFPNFIQNNKTRGVIRVYLSTVPDNYSWVMKLLGAQGDLGEGLRLLNALANTQDTASELQYIAKETQYIYTFALFNVAKQSGKAWAETLKITSDYKTNSLSAFFRSNIALKMNKNETAIKVLEARPQSEEYLPFHFLDYQLGVAKLNKQDVEAIKFLKKFYLEFKGKNYVKSCLQKMSWYYLLAADFDAYNLYKKEILEKGQALNEEDKTAVKYANKQQPNRILLKARLLYDGGYYTDALATINLLTTKLLDSRPEKAEFCYRKGRIYEKLGNQPVAMKFYEACSLFAIDSEEYYGAYSCLYLADYYLSISDKSKAEEFYNKALSFKNNKEYKESIEHRAKAGLKKV